MPLHLLGKKSWNVYNADNIARVRQDEAAAEAVEAAREQRMQEVDAARRTAILRGETPPPIPDDDDRSDGDHRERPPPLSWEKEQRRKRRKLRGEDDTDRDIRLARHERAAADPVKLTDRKGNIQLFSEPPSTQPSSTQEQMGMQFRDAAGYKADPRTGPWTILSWINASSK
ncbi:hypothetical protein ANO11243_071870 [Dothideomycetidae sp. 11243]|nr:hypothetical protein ANO11243_071870 [fungal sp. No.11243]